MLTTALVTAAITATLVGLLVGVRTRLVVVAVHGDSMSPTLTDGQRVLAQRRRSGGYAVGDIVVFRAPDRERRNGATGPDGYLVKRVAALPGERVPASMQPATEPPVRVPRNHVVVLGDNPANSQDSRQFGPIDQRTIVATVRRPVGSAPPLRASRRSGRVAAAPVTDEPPVGLGARRGVRQCGTEQRLPR